MEAGCFEILRSRAIPSLPSAPEHMTSKSLRVWAAIAALTIAPQDPALAQETPRRSPLLDSSVARILAQSSPSEEPVTLLRQVGGSQPHAKRREMADSLVGQAVRRRDATSVLFV